MIFENGLKIMAFGAHPDDVELAAGAWLLYMKQKRKAKVFNVALTPGHTGGDPSVRIEEMKEACDWAGFQFGMLGFTDGQVRQCPEVIDSISSVIGIMQPDIILSHSVADHHQDHVALSLSVMSALRHFDCTHIEYSTSNNRIQAPWNFEFIHDTEDKKKLLSFFKTQAHRPYMRNVSNCERFNLRYIKQDGRDSNR